VGLAYDHLRPVDFMPDGVHAVGGRDAEGSGCSDLIPISGRQSDIRKDSGAPFRMLCTVVPPCALLPGVLSTGSRSGCLCGLSVSEDACDRATGLLLSQCGQHRIIDVQAPLAAENSEVRLLLRCCFGWLIPAHSHCGSRPAGLSPLPDVVAAHCGCAGLSSGTGGALRSDQRNSWGPLDNPEGTGGVPLTRDIMSSVRQGRELSASRRDAMRLVCA
jgi:hypothetical protein